MKRIKRIWRDIRQGENIDLYLTIVFAFGIVIYTLFQGGQNDLIASLTLAMLALVAFSLLGNRYQIEKAYEKLVEDKERVLLQRWPGDSLTNDFRDSRNVLIIGVSLERTIRSNFPTLEEKLKKGHKIRVILVNPESQACEFAARRVYRDINIERTRNGIHTTIYSLKSLLERELGDLQVRGINYPIAVGGFLMDPETSKGVVYLKHFTYRMQKEDIPRLVFRPEDDVWYDFYVKQMQTFWDNSKPIP